MTEAGQPIPYTLAHVWCCDCDDCLNGPIPYKLTGAGRTYPTGGERGAVVKEMELAKARILKRASRARAKARRAG